MYPRSFSKRWLSGALLAVAALTATPTFAAEPADAATDRLDARFAAEQVHYRTAQIEGLKIFYREAGPANAPTILLLHGFPTSSHMFRDLIPRLSDRYHVIAPDYPGFGYSDAPDRAAFAYTFDHFASLVEALTVQLKLERYALYVMDYGAPVGYRLATAHPEKVSALIVQNGNAYLEGITGFWDPIKAYWNTGAPAEREALRWQTTLKATQWQYTNGVRDVSRVNPDAYHADQALLDRPGNAEIQLDLFYDYRNNLPLYPRWQQFFKTYKPPTLVVWGRNDEIFVAAGAAPYRRDNPRAEVHLLDTGHFALETHGPQIASLIRDFLARKLDKSARR